MEFFLYYFSYLIFLSEVLKKKKTYKICNLYCDLSLLDPPATLSLFLLPSLVVQPPFSPFLNLFRPLPLYFCFYYSNKTILVKITNNSFLPNPETNHQDSFLRHSGQLPHTTLPHNSIHSTEHIFSFCVLHYSTSYQTLSFRIKRVQLSGICVSLHMLFSLSHLIQSHGFKIFYLLMSSTIYSSSPEPSLNSRLINPTLKLKIHQTE